MEPNLNALPFPEELLTPHLLQPELLPCQPRPRPTLRAGFSEGLDAEAVEEADGQEDL